MLMGEFVTAVKYGLPIKVVVLKNDVLGQIRWEQMVLLGNPEYAIELQPIDFALFARSCGAIGLSVTEPGACGGILEEALSAPGPVLVEATVDPFEPPLPGSIEPGRRCALPNRWCGASRRASESPPLSSRTRCGNWSEAI
jgi:pyruvate dehydrogenase (quinone)